MVPEPHESPTVVVAVAASQGGITALGRVLSALPADFPGAVLVVQHVSPNHRSVLADILDRRTPLRVKPAEPGDVVCRGCVLVTPPDHHLLVGPDGVLSLSHSPKVHHVRPSAEPLFGSVAGSYGPRAVAVVLTGGDADGSWGVRKVKLAGGTVIAQDEATSEEFSMPRAAIATGCVDMVLALDDITPVLTGLAANR